MCVCIDIPTNIWCVCVYRHCVEVCVEIDIAIVALLRVCIEVCRNIYNEPYDLIGELFLQRIETGNSTVPF